VKINAVSNLAHFKGQQKKQTPPFVVIEKKALIGITGKLIYYEDEDDEAENTRHYLDKSIG